MSRREAVPPPTIRGFTPIELIGVGGYADVFLYEQHMPKRQVAVKVMIADAVAGDTQQHKFIAEANLMARVSTHPFIVSVIEAAIADDARPYIVMEYYPGSNFLERVRREKFSIAEVLRTGIHISSAVETAHRAGILHRDIKPANILTSEYGRAGLTDFGIAAPEDQADDENEGLSIPWAPPEAFGSQRLDERADVYSLAATIYHLAAGRSPFEYPGANNSALELMSRIDRQQVVPTGRPDAPASFERVLANAMAKDPAHRPATAAQFGRLLQGVESEMNLAVTPLELSGDPRSTTRLIEDFVETDDSTRVRGVTEIVAQGDAAVIRSIPSQPTGFVPQPERRREGLLAEPAIEATVHRAPVLAQTAAEETPGRRKTFVVSAVAAVVLSLIAVAVAISVNGSKDNGATASPDPVIVNDGLGNGSAKIASAPGVVENLVGVTNSDGTFGFTWSPPVGAAPGVIFQVTETETAKLPRSPQPPQQAASFTSPVPCIEVIAIVANLTSSPVPKCAGS